MKCSGTDCFDRMIAENRWYGQDSLRQGVCVHRIHAPNNSRITDNAIVPFITIDDLGLQRLRRIIAPDANLRNAGNPLHPRLFKNNFDLRCGIVHGVCRQSRASDRYGSVYGCPDNSVRRVVHRVQQWILFRNLDFRDIVTIGRKIKDDVTAILDARSIHTIIKTTIKHVLQSRTATKTAILWDVSVWVEHRRNVGTGNQDGGGPCRGGEQHRRERGGEESCFHGMEGLPEGERSSCGRVRPVRRNGPNHTISSSRAQARKIAGHSRRTEPGRNGRKPLDSANCGG